MLHGVLENGLCASREADFETTSTFILELYQRKSTDCEINKKITKDAELGKIDGILWFLYLFFKAGFVTEFLLHLVSRFPSFPNH